MSKKKNKKEELVSIIVPKDSSNPNHTVIRVQIDGVDYAVRRGVKQEVPLKVYEILLNSSYMKDLSESI